jgi:beta-amylase
MTKALLASALLGASASIPVFVMLPLDVISNDGTVKDASSLTHYFTQLSSANVEGVMADCWWGIAERQEKDYDFSAYSQLTQVSNAACSLPHTLTYSRTHSLTHRLHYLIQHIHSH